MLDLEDPALFSKRVVMQDGHQDLMVIETHQGKRSKYDLDSLTTPHKIAAVVARVGTTVAKFSFYVCVFKRARQCQQRVFWSCDSLYTFFGSKTFKGLSSVWFARSQ